MNTTHGSWCSRFPMSPLRKSTIRKRPRRRRETPHATRLAIQLRPRTQRLAPWERAEQRTRWNEQRRPTENKATITAWKSDLEWEMRSILADQKLLEIRLTA